MRLDAMNELLFNLQSGFKSLSRHPLFALVIIAFMALGIGLNAAAFSIVNALLLRPVPGVEDPQKVVAIFTRIQGNPFYLPVSFPNFQDLRRESRELGGIAAYQSIRVAQTGGREAEWVPGAMTSSNYFDVLGVHPFRGRFFGVEEDERLGAAPVVVLAHGFWQRQFGADPRVIGRPILLNGSAFTVIGIAPPAFRGTNLLAPAQLWVPLTMYRQVYSGADLFPKRGDQTLQLLGRLRPGRGIEEAAAEIRTLGDRLVEVYPNENHDQSFAILFLSESALTPNGRASFVEVGTFLMASALLLLLIACLNISCLLLARTLARTPEMAIRLSLGAGRGQLARQLLTEGLLLAAISCGVCLLIAAPGAHLLWRLRPPFLQQEVLLDPVDGRVLAFGLLVSLLAGMVFGLMPLLQTMRSDLVSPLKGSSESSVGKSWRLPLGNVLVVSQIALCFSALMCASFFLRSSLQAQRIDPGFATQDLITISFDLQSQRFGETQARTFEQQLLQRVRVLPGVRAAAFAENRLLGGARFSRIVSLQPGPGSATADNVLVSSNSVGFEYFKTVGIPILNGRTFDASDRPMSDPEVIINATMARKLWPEKDPIGEPLFLDGSEIPHRIVGVARDAKVTTLGEPDRPFLYLMRSRFQTPTAILHVRVAGDSHEIVDALRREVGVVAPALPLVEVRTIQEILRESLWWQRASAMLLSIFSLLALLLAGLGIYGVTAYSTRRRRYEIGIRMALGARRPSLVALISSRGFVMGALGIVLGLPFALGLHRLARTLLFETDAATLSTLLGTGGLVLVVSLIASVIPAVRIARADPVSLLRAH